MGGATSATLVPNSGLETSATGVVEVRVIQGVVCLCAEQEGDALFDLDVLHEGEVKINGRCELRSADAQIVCSGRFGSPYERSLSPASHVISGCSFFLISRLRNHLHNLHIAASSH